MKISILTLFPNMFDGFLNESIIKRAILKKIVEIEIINIRDYSKHNNKQVDDTPYGGGAGMVMMIDVLVECLNAIKKDYSKVYLMSPSGEVFKEKTAYSLTNERHIILICGHYEGVDERINYYIDGKFSIGDYVLTGGELPSMVISDAIIRLLDGVITKESIMTESFNNNLLDYPVYTKPASFDGHDVPEVLLSGNHKLIDEYRKNEQIRITKEVRPDLLD